MYQRVNFSDFRQAFHNHDRGNQFSYEGLKALFDFLEEQEQDTNMKEIVAQLHSVAVQHLG